MRISDLELLQALDWNISFPVSIAGRTVRVTLRQVADVLSASSIALFDGVVSEDVTLLTGTTEAEGDVVYLATRHSFAYRVQPAGSDALYYDTWSDVAGYMADGTPLHSNLFIDRTTWLMYHYDAVQGWCSISFSTAEREQLQRNTPIAVADEETMEQMIANGQCIDGQLYYIAED
jgi:hypothetical protein